MSVPRGSRLALPTLLLALLAPPTAGAELPQKSSSVHLGVATCSGAPCHGNRAASANGRVLQNEYATWSRRDAHARAYEVLRGELGRRIAANLGLPAPAHETPLCLDCHADFVPESRRGEKFSLEDGVGCEACHGGAETWLGAHISGTGDHADYVAKGLYPTDEPVARAELCVSCHFGTGSKFVTHRMMGAGHPRMSLEVDTFTEIQPAHFRVDADYRERGKTAAEGVRVWAIGQAVIVRSILDALLDRERAFDGIWPELVLYDCHACHHPMSVQRWSPRASTGLYGAPGVPRLNDSSFLMLRHALAAVDPTAAEELRSRTRDLHRALSRGTGSPRTAAKRLRSLVADAIPKLVSWPVTVAAVRTIAGSLVRDASRNEFRDYAAAEQVAMALQSLASTLHAMGAIESSELAELQSDLDAILELTESDERYRPQALSPLLSRIELRLR